MYNAYYGFRESPFNLTPDSSLFYPSPKHRAALDALVYTIRERKGFVVLSGEIGSGKTTVARALLKRLGERVKTAVITNTYITPKGVITMILEDLGVTYQPGTKERLLIQLNDYLVEQAKRNRDIVVMIDEAQNLSMSCLEEVRMLSNLETEKEKLVQIILMGQPEMKKKLLAPRLEQLRQRIAVQYHLSPLEEPETIKYIHHRLEQVSENPETSSNLFDQNTLGMIYRYSGGVPRMINKICDHALLTGFVNEVRVITPEILLESVQDLLMIGEDRQHEQIFESTGKNTEYAGERFETIS